MTTLEAIFTATSLTLEAATIGTVAWGIRQWRLDEDRRTKRADARHAESMKWIQQRSEALKQMGEDLRQTNEALRDQGEALRQQGAALQVAIERTGGRHE